jgi:hypothetical protein
MPGVSDNDALPGSTSATATHADDSCNTTEVDGSPNPSDPEDTSQGQILAPWDVSTGFEDNLQAKEYICMWAAHQGFQAKVRDRKVLLSFVKDLVNILSIAL